MSALTDFYQGTHADSEGRTLANIWAFSDADSESTHDFIQWLFPLREPSRFNPDAPLLTDADIAEFRTDPALKANTRRSFEVFLAFLGLCYENGRVTSAGDFDKKSSAWRHPNHNWLRVTRVLTSTRLLGLETESAAFFQFLKGLREARSGVTAETFHYWEQASGAGPDK